MPQSQPPKPSEHPPRDTAAEASAANARDVVVLGPPTADGDGVHVLRARDERLEAGELRTLREGKPIQGEIVSLAPRKDNPQVCDVKDSWSPPAGATFEGTRKGPAQVASDTYRERWDEIFGDKTKLN